MYYALILIMGKQLQSKNFTPELESNQEYLPLTLPLTLSERFFQNFSPTKNISPANNELFICLLFGHFQGEFFQCIHCKKKISDCPDTRRDVTNQTLPGRE